MGGLAVGAWVAGRAASTMTPARALRTYAAARGVRCGLRARPAGLLAALPILRWMYAGDNTGSFGITIAQLALLRRCQGPPWVPPTRWP